MNIRGYFTSATALSAPKMGTRCSQSVEVGTQLFEGTRDPKDILRVLNVREVQKHLVEGVQGVYKSQGVPIHDKHIELIVRQMIGKSKILFLLM